MNGIILRSFSYLVLYLFGLISGSFAFSVVAFLVYARDFYRTYVFYNERFWANLIINFGLGFFIFSCLLLDSFPNIYLFEVDAVSSFYSITPLALIYLCPVFAIVNRPINKMTAAKLFRKAPLSILKLGVPFIWIGFSLLNFMFLNLFRSHGLPIFEGIQRIIFYNQLSSYELTLYLMLSVFSSLFGFLQSIRRSRMNVLALIIIILIRILSMQKFTELLIDLSLFFSFQFCSGGRAGKSLSRVSPWKIGFVIILTSLLIGFSVFTYNYEVEILLGRFLAQAQLFFVIVGEGLRFLPDATLVSREFRNFAGSNDYRLYLFGMGQYYGLYTLMDVANTGRNLYLQAAENTSSAGSFPAINILLFGWLIGYVVTIVSTYIVCFIARGILFVSAATRNPLNVVFGTLVLIRCYKYFLIGSPSYLYNIQFLQYGALLLLVTAFHFYPNVSKEASN